MTEYNGHSHQPLTVYFLVQVIPARCTNRCFRILEYLEMFVAWLLICIICMFSPPQICTFPSAGFKLDSATFRNLSKAWNAATLFHLSASSFVMCGKRRTRRWWTRRWRTRGRKRRSGLVPMGKICWRWFKTSTPTQTFWSHQAQLCVVHR